MYEFCEKALVFLKSEYSDSYDFEIDLYKELDEQEDKIELKIRVNNSYKILVTPEYMQHIFLVYNSGEFITDRNQYAWQKELIDIIEGA